MTKSRYVSEESRLELFKIHLAFLKTFNRYQVNIGYTTPANWNLKRKLQKRIPSEITSSNKFKISGKTHLHLYGHTELAE